MRHATDAVGLTEAERAQLRALAGRGEGSVRMLLEASQGESGPAWTDAASASAREVRPATVVPVRRAGVGYGLEGALQRKAPDRIYGRPCDGNAEAQPVARARSAPPAGRERWTLRLQADALVSWEVVDTVSCGTVHRTFQQTL
jgi:hypothetical protein